MVAVSRFRLRFRRRPAAGGLKPRRDLEAAGPRLRSVRWIQEDNLRSASGLAQVLRFAVGMPSECSRQASGRSGTIAHAVAGHPSRWRKIFRPDLPPGSWLRRMSEWRILYLQAGGWRSTMGEFTSISSTR